MLDREVAKNSLGSWRADVLSVLELECGCLAQFALLSVSYQLITFSRLPRYGGFLVLAHGRANKTPALFRNLRVSVDCKAPADRSEIALICNFFTVKLYLQDAYCNALNHRLKMHEKII